METKKEELINEILCHLSCFDGKYEFKTTDEMLVTTSYMRNDYHVTEVYESGDSIKIRVETEWETEAEFDGEKLTERSLRRILDRMEPPLTLWVTDNNEKTIYTKDFRRRIMDTDDAYSELEKIFNLNWVYDVKNEDNPWQWVYHYDNETVLTATFE